MPRPGPTTQAKRSRERARQERQQEKVEKRAQRKELRKERDRLIADGVDPDLMDLEAGPQAQLAFTQD